VSRQDVIACFLSASAANFFLTGSFLRGPKSWKSLVLYYTWMVVNHFPYSSSLVPGVIFDMLSYNFKKM
jgi:hypothetical protein